MDISNYTKKTGAFLKAADVMKTPSAPFNITEEAKPKKSEKFGVDRLQIVGEFNGAETTFDCSKTNARIIESALGPDTFKWIGHQLFFEVYKTKTTAGAMTDALNVKSVK